MKKSILLVFMFLVGNGAFAQGKVNMQNSSASTQTGVVKSQPQAPAATSGIMMNDIEAVSGSYLNGEISIDGDGSVTFTKCYWAEGSSGVRFESN